MRAGLLRHKVEIQKLEGHRNELGEWVEDWVTFANVWAEVRDLRGREFWNALWTVSEVTTRVLIRHMPGITPSMRVLHGDRLLEIQYIIEPEGRSRELQLMCKEARIGG